MIVDAVYCGYRLRLRIESQKIIDQAQAYFRPALCTHSGVDWEFELTSKSVRQLAGLPMSDAVGYFAFGSLELRLLEMLVAEMRGQSLLHAACFEMHGRVCVILAPSGGGKSALTRAALGQGATYITDDALRLHDGAMFGLARAIRHDAVQVSPGPPLPSFLQEMDLETFASTWGEQLWTTPLWWQGAPVLLERSIPREEVVVVRVSRGPARIQEMSSLARLVALHEAAIAGTCEYDGALGGGPAYDLSWQESPQEAFALLATELSRLSLNRE